MFQAYPNVGADDFASFFSFVPPNNLGFSFPVPPKFPILGVA